MAVNVLSECRTVSALDVVSVSIVIPCLNEAESIVQCVTTAYRVLEEHAIEGEVVVVDNGSDDGSADLARFAGATVVDEPRRGYGSAYLAGFAAARGDYIVMIDADLTYDFEEIPRFVRELELGAELVMGNRMGAVQPGAMSMVSRIGNPLMSRFLNFLFRTPVCDTWCGLRAFRRDVLPVLGLRASGMELASEMVIRAARRGLEIRELPIALHPRTGESKLSPFRDGWRSLRLMLVYNPNFLFVVPGVLFSALGLLLMGFVLARVPFFGNLVFVHMIGASLLLVVGTQLVGFGLCGRFYAVYQLGDHDPWLEGAARRVRLEHGLLLGFALMAGGFVLGILATHHQLAASGDSLTETRMSILSVTLLIVGVQVFFTSFLLSLIGLRRRA